MQENNVDDIEGQGTTDKYNDQLIGVSMVVNDREQKPTIFPSPKGSKSDNKRITFHDGAEMHMRQTG